MRSLALTDSGQVTVDDSGGIRINGAGSVTPLIAVATNFEGFDRAPGSGGTDPSGICRERLQGARRRGFEELRSRHVQDHQALFRRVELQLGRSENGRSIEALATDERMEAYREGRKDAASRR